MGAYSKVGLVCQKVALLWGLMRRGMNRVFKVYSGGYSRDFTVV